MFKVNGKPFFSIGGQLHNSSSNCLEDMKKGFKALKLINANTVAVPIMWELFEKVENEFDYTQLHNVLSLCKENDMKLVVLWFGSWKNGMSQYAPQWIKKDKERFDFVQTGTGRVIQNLSAVGEENLRCDAKAFVKLVEEIKKIDGGERVIAIQVQNESGILGSDRDYSKKAQNLFDDTVPKELIQAIQKAGKGKVFEDYKTNGELINRKWEDTFGYYAGEYFTAYHTSKYVEKIAKFGKEIMDIPMYTNVWLKDMYISEPGASYPSGGATANVLEIWKAFTPSLFTIAPDIYVNNLNRYKEVCAQYNRSDNPLYVPESSLVLPNALAMFGAVCDFNSIGFHCFAIDSILRNDGEINDAYCGDIAVSLKILSNCKNIIENKVGKLYSVIQEEFTSQNVIDFGDYIGVVKFVKSNPSGDASGEEWLDTFHNIVDCTDSKKIVRRGRGIINDRGNGEFFIAGTGFRVVFIKKESIENMSSGVCSNEWLSTRQSNYISVDEGNFKDDVFVAKRKRNGDETDHGVWVTDDIGLVKVILN